MSNSAQNDKFSTEWQNKPRTNSPQNDKFSPDRQIQARMRNSAQNDKIQLRMTFSNNKFSEQFQHRMKNIIPV